MFFTSKIIKGFALLSITTLLLVSCATYHQRIQDYHASIRTAQYSKANKQLDHIKFLQKNRNRLLYVLEKGKTLHLMQQYESSNKYLHEADLLIEISRKTMKDIVLTGLLNPMHSGYEPEDFEKFMVYYYKALNFLFLGDTEAALVEARRISIQNYAQEDKFNGRHNRYSNDAFALMIQGIIYEKANDLNNAFIAYRNAAEVYLQNNKNWYGTEMPLQLKKDVLRTAAGLGFNAELQKYERIFSMTYTPEAVATGGEAIIFLETGMAPVKQQEMIEFRIYKNADTYFFRDRAGSYNLPFDNNTPGYSQNMPLTDLKVFAIALPKYELVQGLYQQANVSFAGNSYSFEKAQDINVLAMQTLKERYARELATALSRLAIKKFTEMALAPKADAQKKYDSEEERQKAERLAERQKMLAFGLQIFNRVSEQADTRNWQSLPATIFYSRIPLLAGENNCSLTVQENTGTVHTKTLQLQGGSGLQFKSIYSTW